MVSILLCFTLPVSTDDTSAYWDDDLAGLYRNYNTDDSREAAIAFDYGDDNIWKIFYLGEVEYANADYAHIWVYAKSWGVEMETSQGYSHYIKVYNNAWMNGKVIYTFYSFEQFDKDTYQWQRFELPLTHFRPNSWNKIRIHDADPAEENGVDGWVMNNLRIGIDQTFGKAEDFDQSMWKSGGAGVNPTCPQDNEGELMIALELVDARSDWEAFPSLQTNFDNAWSASKNFVFIDDYNDKACYQVYVSEDVLDDAIYARLYVYGAAWSSNPGSETSLNVEVNDLYYAPYEPMEDFGACRPILAWSWIDLDVGFLQEDEWNTFEFRDTTSWQHTNIAIGLFTSQDFARSKWRYWDGQDWHGNYNYYTDDGEMAIYLVLYNDQLKESQDRQVYTIELSNGAGMNPRPYEDQQTFLWAEPGIEDFGNYLGGQNDWDNFEVVQYDWTQQNVVQGLIYNENSIQGADGCDFLVFGGHGMQWQSCLPEWDILGDTEEYGDMERFDYLKFNGNMAYYTEAEFFPYPVANYATGYGQDGLNFNVEWVLFFSCYSFGTWIGGNNYDFETDSPFQTLLYHNTHIVLGFYDIVIVNPGDMDDFTELLYDYMTSGGQKTPRKIVDAFERASSEYRNGGAPWAYFAHDNNIDDYLWDEMGSVTDDNDMIRGEKFEHKDDIVYDSKP